MQASTAHAPASAIVPLAAAEMQDHLLTAVLDLDRLHALLTHACGDLLAVFRQTTAWPERHAGDTEALGAAVTALQFEDLASQLLNHTRQRLRHCADRLACSAMPGEAGFIEEAPRRPNPVTQDEMRAGNIELF